MATAAPGVAGHEPASERDRLRLRSISHENFTIGSVMRQAPTQKDLVALAAEQCAPVLVKVRHWLTTSNRRLFKLVHSVDPSTFTDKAVSVGDDNWSAPPVTGPDGTVGLPHRRAQTAAHGDARGSTLRGNAGAGGAGAPASKPT